MSKNVPPCSSPTEPTCAPKSLVRSGLKITARPTGWSTAWNSMSRSTRRRAALTLRPNGNGAAPAPLMLDGEALKLRALKLDGAALPPEQFVATPDQLTIAQPPQRRFRLEIETVVDPSANTQLLGLYR